MSVVEAVSGKYLLQENELEIMRRSGGGGAPEGMCGGAFAVEMILDKYSPEKTAWLLSAFLEKAGSLNCREIRGMKKLSCLGCVALSAELLSEVLEKKS